MRESYSYQSVLAASERVAFRLDEVLPEQAELAFDKPFLPESLTRGDRHTALSAEERLVFNQVFAHTYLCMFGLVEEFIVPFLLDHARLRTDEHGGELRALLTFASEEAKHIELFRRFRGHFERGFASSCEVVGPAGEVARAVLSHRPLAVGLLILQTEWLTQRHYVESVRSDEQLEPRIKNLLKQHWLEEAQHAKLDTLVVEQLAAQLNQPLIEASVDDYLTVCTELSSLLGQQAELDVQALARKLGKRFEPHVERDLVRAHSAALRDTFLCSGMSHPSFLSTLRALSPRGAARTAEALVSFRTASQQGDAQ